MSTRCAPTFELSDSSPVRTGQKHRRGMGHANNGRRISGEVQSSSLSAGAMYQQQTQSQTSYYTTDAWDNADSYQRKDDIPCSGSLTYSSCSSEGNAGSDKKASFADIIKLIESEVEGEGASELKSFISKKSVAASDMVGINYTLGGENRGLGSQIDRDTAVAERTQRAEGRSMQKQKWHQTKVREQTSTAALAKSMELKCNVDDREEDRVFGLGFDDNFLDTITGHDDDRQNPYQTSFATPRNRSSGNVTPPPNSRHERMSTSSPGANSHHSKSSSDGSWETPIPSSPPHSGTTTTKPPQARSAPITRLGHTPGRGCETNEAFYAKSWMSGFSDAFNFDGFDKDETFDFDGFKFQK